MKIRRPWTLLAVAGALAVVALKLAWPFWSGGLPACSFRALTGLHCPGCGGTRCTGRLLDGDIAGAFSMNAAVVVLLLVAGGMLSFAVVREWRGRRDAMPLIPGWFAWCLAGFVIAFGLTRNLPWWPFTLLVPH
ncbi:DUF2752 domain-containing protein [Luteolibacter sp. Populi]|uniref:DUF2752 domain-containing protein n=1 Tax=Luteolibacter sp. Populi TaxID=3230487 RepID=UPI0034655161